ncbi:MAG TPA: DUF1153 domain-containing protein [Rhizomicrobium sp.]|nr:DUF1153 domain-containing protein [Rhizomicrobium sp.]
MGSRTRNFGRADQILGVDGGMLTAADLPPKNLKRWVARRKAEIIAAVEGGLLTESEACARYNISREEFESWCNAFQKDGLQGLRARKLARGSRRYAANTHESHAAPESIPHTGLD